jgi:hypothetical protein
MNQKIPRISLLTVEVLVRDQLRLLDLDVVLVIEEAAPLATVWRLVKNQAVPVPVPAPTEGVVLMLSPLLKLPLRKNAVARSLVDQ